MNANALVGLAVVFLVLWIVLRLALAVTTGLLHLLWIAAVLMFIIWLVGKFRRPKSD